MADPWLLMWLEAPLQSWGADSRFGRRDSLDFPTRSGVLGLICCALGRGGEQREWLEQMASYPQNVIAYVRTRSAGEGKSERAIREPLLRDFHMIGAGYNLSDPWQKLLEPHMANGKRRTSPGGGAKMTYRYYLQDMAYAIIMPLPEEEAETIAEALQNPCWDLYLGRKNCVPTDFIYRGLFPSGEEAETAVQGIAREKQRIADFRVLQGEHDGEVLTLNDIPVRFGTHKQYRDRQVTMIPL
ncbi:type I-E CRISPR-associated protein Cas5/CasD [Thiolapillus sp.]